MTAIGSISQPAGKVDTVTQETSQGVKRVSVAFEELWQHVGSLMKQIDEFLTRLNRAG
jgi:hypothetical protein